MKLGLNHLAPYMPYGLTGIWKNRKNRIYKVTNVCVCGNGNISFGHSLKTRYKHEINRPLDEFKPLLIPLSELSLTRFEIMCQDAFGWDETYAAVINGYYAVCRKEKDDDDELDAQSHWTDSDYIAAAEEIDYDNVISIRKVNPKAVFQFDIAFGCGDEMRYFADFAVTEGLRNQLFKQHFDVFGLIGADLAINKTEHLKQ